MSREVWKPIPQYAGYEASNYGNVRSWKQYGPLTPHLLAKCDDQGYDRVNLSRIARRVHRLVLEAFVGELPKGMVSRHLNGDRKDNRLVNLSYGTPAQNMRDRVTHGNDANANKTVCINGHEFTPENTRVVARSAGGDTYRLCRICRNKVKRDSYHRRNQRAVDEANA